nr:MAG TPA: hypothetical protein [Caudoviricetes sp.]
MRRACKGLTTGLNTVQPQVLGPLFAHSGPPNQLVCPLCAKSGIWNARGSNVSYQRC